jgi:hypothetical protein
VDQIVGVMLFHKLNAIMEGRISVVEIELSSSIGDHMVYIHNENETTQDINMPGWWTSPDLTHAEIEFNTEDTVLAIHPHHYTVWHELDMAWSDEDTPKETGNIVFADFGRDETK